MLFNLIIALPVGGVMGVLMHIKRHGKILKPRNTKTTIQIGVFEEVLWGMAGATLLVFLSEPTDWWRAAFLSIIGGYGGESVVRQHEYNKTQTKLENQQQNSKKLEEDLDKPNEVQPKQIDENK
jgi:hypothetical protein